MRELGEVGGKELDKLLLHLGAAAFKPLHKPVVSTLVAGFGVEVGYREYNVVIVYC
jgi:hypothetical protein